MAERAERLAAFSFGDGAPVETGVVLVDAPITRKPKGKKKKGGMAMHDFMPSTITIA